jgi:prolyl-tRNA synthetase
MIDSKSAPNGGELSFARGIEVGHIFQLGDKYSKSMGLSVLDHEGQKISPLMGCYGIGISRIVAASIEQNHDEKGIIWPEQIAPFDYIIIVLNDKNHDITSKAKEIYKAIKSNGSDVMIDDRDERAGVKFAEADLIGIPNQIIVSRRGLDQNTIELVNRSTGGKEDIAINELVEKISS